MWGFKSPLAHPKPAGQSYGTPLERLGFYPLLPEALAEPGFKPVCSLCLRARNGRWRAGGGRRRSGRGPEVRTALSATGEGRPSGPIDVAKASPQRGGRIDAVPTRLPRSAEPLRGRRSLPEPSRSGRRRHRTPARRAQTRSVGRPLRARRSRRGQTSAYRSRPPHSSVVPVEGCGFARQEIDAEFGIRAVGNRVPQSAATDPAVAGELYDARPIDPGGHDGHRTGRYVDPGRHRGPRATRPVRRRDTLRPLVCLRPGSRRA